MSGLAKFVGAAVLGVVVYVFVNRFFNGNQLAGGIGAIGTFILCLSGK